MSYPEGLPMEVTVNGRPTTVPRGTTVAALVSALGLGRRLGGSSGPGPEAAGSAVAVNLEVVPRSSWSTTELADQDRVEVLTAAQGG